MRKTRHPNVVPPTIQKLRDHYGTNIGLPRKDGGPPEGKWNNPDVRGALFGVQSRVCAYCQRELSDNRGDVEHYRPKSSYRGLMYEMSNFFVSCRICNQNRKGKKFQLVDDDLPASDSDPKAILEERRLLLDPAEDPVDKWVRVDYDDDICAVDLSPVAASEQAAAQRVPYTRDFFWLNVDNEITTDRFEKINEAMEEALLARDGDPRATKRIRRMASRYNPHGQAVYRMLAERCPKVPLPTLQEELQWHVSTVLDRIDRAEKSLKHVVNSSQRKDVKRKKDENIWSLSVIWADPPEGIDPDTIKKLYETSEFYEEIREKYLQLKA